MDKFDLQKHMLRHYHCYHDIFYVYDRLYYLYYHCGYDLVVPRQKNKKGLITYEMFSNIEQ